MPCREIEQGVKEDNDQMPRISKIADRADGQQLPSATSPAWPRCNTPIRSAGADALARHRRGPPRAFAQARRTTRPSQDKLTQDQPLVLRAVGVPGQAAGGNARAGRTGSLLDNTLIVWTNELGKGNTHTLDNIPFVHGRRRTRLPHGPIAQVPQRAAQSPALALAHAMGHEIKTFGNPDYCGAGPLTGLA